MTGLRAVLQLLRFPNVFTAIADVVAGFLFVQSLEGASDIGTPDFWVTLGFLVIGSSALYLSGMVFNDVFDRELDARERPERPIPSGAVSESAARKLAWTLMIFGLISAIAAGIVAQSVVPPAIGVALSACILLYDGVLKSTPLGPWTMGACRSLNVLLGMSVAPQSWSYAAILTAAAVGIYIAGVTWFARSEADQPQRRHLIGGLAVLLAGVAMLVPVLSLRAAAGAAVVIGPSRWSWFLLLFGALVGTRCLSAILDPTPGKTQLAVKSAILSLIVLDAGICFLCAGGGAAIGVLALLIPAMVLGRFVYST